MKVRFNGTAAAEGFPALFCDCEHCRDARRLGGKNIRCRSSVLINEEYMVDFSADVFAQTLYTSLDISKVRHIFITHSHMDHLCAENLLLRGDYFAHCNPDDKLYVYAHKAVFEKIKSNPELEKDKSWLKYIELVEVKPFVEFQAGNMKVFPIKADHVVEEGEQALLYHFELNGESYLHLFDTGLLFDEDYEELKKHNKKADITALDCCCCNMYNERQHMGMECCAMVRDRLIDEEIADDKSQFIITHFSHNCRPIHEELEQSAEKYGFEVAYDGFIKRI